MTNTPKTLTQSETSAFLYALLSRANNKSRSRKAYRNHCLALLMLDAGLRVGEATRLFVSDLWFKGEPVSNLTVPAEIAKNHKERSIPVSARLRSAIIAHAACEWPNPTQCLTWYAFYYRAPFKPITTRQVERTFARIGLKSIGKKVNPHLLRHTFASRLMRKTNARIVQELLGHSSLTSTQIYTHPNSDDLKDAIDSLDC